MPHKSSGFDDVPPFPSNLPTSPIVVISHKALLSGDPAATAAALEACQTYGFFYLDLRDTSIGQSLVDWSEDLLLLSKKAFDVPLEDKKAHALQKGVSLFGYKSAGVIKKTDPQLRPDSTEFFNISKDHLHGVAKSRSYPDSITQPDEWKVLQDFSKTAHETGMLVLRRLGTALGLDPEDLPNLNTFGKESGDHVRLTHKFPHPTDANAVGLPSHTDFGSVTILFNWLGGLQIESRTQMRTVEEKDEQGNVVSTYEKPVWDFVKPVPGHAIINLGDATVKFTNGALKSAKHRVVPAPGEQRDVDRYSVVYFVRPCHDSLMKPVGKFEFSGDEWVKVGGKVSVEDEDNKVFTAGEWMVRRAIQMGS